MKAILIARVSTEEQKEAGNSLPAQVARLERYCQNKDYEIIRICSFDESAYKGQREEFDRILDFILEQTEKVIVCCDKVDRLSRNVFDKRIALLYEQALNDKIELHFISDGQMNGCQLWLYLADTFRNGQIEFGVSLQHIQTVYSSFGIKLKI